MAERADFLLEREQAFVSTDRFDKFTDRARKVLTLAQDEAQRFNHNYIGTEHLLLGLVREGEGVAVRILEDFGVDGDAVRDEVIRQVGGVPPPRPYPRPKRRHHRVPSFVLNWALGAVTLGAGILIGWAIWG